MDMSQYLGVFLDEAREHLQNLNDKLMILEENADDPELINSIFRSAHTLKGSSGQMGFQNMMELTHIMENVFDALRHHTIQVNSEMIDVLFEGLDHLEGMADQIEQNGNDASDVSDTKKKLQAITSGKQSTQNDDPSKKQQETKDQLPQRDQQVKLTDYEKLFAEQAADQNLTAYEVTVDLNKDCVLKAARALMVSNALEELGTIIGTRPATEEIEKEAFNQRLIFIVASTSEAEQIQETINSISEIANVKVTHIHSLEDRASSEQSQPAREDGTSQQDKSGKQSKKAEAHRPVVVAKTIRVNLNRIDQLLNLFEELIIDRGRLEKIASEIGNATLNDTVSTIKRVSNQLQETILNLRMEPIEQVFNRFPRLVRNLAKELNKKVNFVVKGSETELDRTVIEELGDPIMHMIRNSMDHGIEHPDVRKEKGKDPQGTLTLAAYYSGNHVFVEIEDDGAGINREKVLAKAVEKKIVPEESASELSDKEVYHLLFASGFSTADKISDISGRGVGLDVVESKIHSLSGSVEVDSAPGKGTKFTVKLPLTLSIINALLVQCGDEIYAIPITSIAETALKRHVKMMNIHEQTVAQYHEQIVPIIDLGDYLSVPGYADHEERGHSVVIVHHGSKYAALIVDHLIGYQDIVVKPLGNYLKNVSGFSGATILGDGNVALIIDCQTVMKNQTIPSRKENI